MKCSNCGQEIAPDANFCPHCGFFNGDHAQLPYEMMKLTYLRADLHEFTKMSEEMLSEEIMSYLNDVFRQFQKIIESFKGSIYQIIGDEVVSIFGFRKEAGFAPHMAIFAAEEMFNQLNEVNKLRTLKRSVGLKIGIETEASAIFNLQGDLRNAFIISEGFVKSQLLQKNAENNSLLVGENIFLATRAFFGYRDAGEIVDNKLSLKSYELKFKTRS
jgi:Adenylate and Guanylate cyclase catalytic domain/zinc-ribbon domain